MIGEVTLVISRSRRDRYPICGANRDDPDDQPDRYFNMIKFWMDETSGVALALKNGVTTYQVEDEEGGTHFTDSPAN